MTGPRHRKPSGRVHRRQQHCDIDGCEREFFSRHWCSLHYNRWHNFGDPLYVTDTSRPALERFMEKVSKPDGEDGCWEWQAYVNPATGYGTFKISEGQTHPAHRAGWLLMRGPLTNEQVCDHLCRVRHCVNPDHLEPVTNWINVQRGERRSKTHCLRGHPLSGENLYIIPRYGYRACRACRSLRARARRAALNAGLPPSL